MSKNKNKEYLDNFLSKALTKGDYSNNSGDGSILELDTLKDMVQKALNEPYDAVEFQVKTFKGEDNVLSVIFEENLMAMIEVGLEPDPADEEEDEQFLVCSIHAGCVPLLAIQISERIKAAVPIMVYYDSMFFPKKSESAQKIGLSWGSEAVMDFYDSIYSLIEDEKTDKLSSASDGSIIH